MSPRRILTIAAALAMSACTPVTQSTAPSAEDRRDSVEETSVRDRQPPADAVRYTIVSANSEIRVLTFRAGTMARLGHNHVILSRALSGSVWRGDSLTASVARVVMKVDSLEVDEPAARAQEGDEFARPIDDDARAATRANMLGPDLLNVEQHAFVRATCSNLTGTEDATIDCAIEVAGGVANLVLPVSVSFADNQLTASGEVTIAHDQLGLTPFSAAAGAVRVADGMTLRYRIVAQRLSQ